MWVKQKRVALLVSLCNVIIMSVLTYVLNNQPLFTGEDLNHFAWIEMVKNKLGIEKPEAKDDVLFVNIANDKQLIELSDEFGMPTGNTDITDRSKLLRFLQLLQSTNQYQYIFLDVRFEKGFDVPEVDSLLFAEICGMKNIVLARHSDIDIADSSLLRKSGISDYNSTIVSTNFVRYRYLYGDKPSMPLFAFQEMKGKDINRHCFFYTCDGKLCYNSLFVAFPIESFNEFDSENRKTYYNLGSDLLDNYSEEDIGVLTKGKYVVIGDMKEDMHDTYSGLRPGSVITFYAFRSLMEGKHIVSFWLMIIMAVTYFSISFSQFSYHPILESIPFVSKSKSKLLHFVLSFVGYALLLSVVVILLDLFWGISTSIILPSTYFAIQKNIINYKRSKI